MADNKQHKNSYFQFFIMIMLLTGFSFFEKWMPQNLKFPWSVFSLVIGVVVYILLLKSTLQKEKSFASKAIDILVFSFVLLCISDMVVKYPFFSVARTLWSSSLFVVIAGVILALLTRFAGKKD